MLARAIPNVFSSFPFGYGAIGTVGYSLEYPRRGRTKPSIQRYQYRKIAPSVLTPFSLFVLELLLPLLLLFYVVGNDLDGWLIPVAMTREQLLGGFRIDKVCYRYRYCYTNPPLLPQYGVPYHTHSTYIK